MSEQTSANPFRPELWEPVDGFDFTDITYHRAKDLGCVRIAFDRPEVLNAFRPHTVDELYRALDHARRTADVGVVLLTGNGPARRDPVLPASGRSVPAVTSASEVVRATSTRTARPRTPSTNAASRPRADVCTSSRCSA